MPLSDSHLGNSSAFTYKSWNLVGRSVILSQNRPECRFDEIIQSAMEMILGNRNRGHDLLDWPDFEWTCWIHHGPEVIWLKECAAYVSLKPQNEMGLYSRVRYIEEYYGSSIMEQKSLFPELQHARTPGREFSIQYTLNIILRLWCKSCCDHGFLSLGLW